MDFGWNGKVLEIDLKTLSFESRPLAPEEKYLYLGGRGLGVKILYERLDSRSDPFAPENILVFASGPLTGTSVPTAGRHAVVSKSPLTGTVFDGSAGGFWGQELKHAGYDGLVIQGKAKEPVFLLIQDKEISFQPAPSLWGKNVAETTAALSRYGQVACIGRAGENRVRFAAVMHGKNHACGRGGLGAVMGSKNLKAIVVKGEGKPAIANQKLFQKHRAEIQRLLIANPVTSKGLATYGTSVLVNLINHLYLLPTNNFRQVHFEDAFELSGEKINETWEVKKTPCAACPLGCKRKIRKGLEIPEYETIALLGASCTCADLKTIVKLNHLCNDYGLDTISTGGTLACFAELEGRTLGGEEMETLVREIGERKGKGRELGEGSAHYAFSQGHPELSMQVKGLELPGYDPRGARGLALAYATSNRGGCHLRAYLVGPEILGKPKLIDRFTFQGKADLVPVFQNFAAALDSLLVCLFTSFGVGEEELARILTATTGIEFKSEDLLRVGERIWNLERLFNLREGFTRADDTLPSRFFQKSEDGKADGIHPTDFASCLNEYYCCRSWDEEGVPTSAKLQALSLKRE